MRAVPLSKWPPLRASNGGVCAICRCRDDGFGVLTLDRRPSVAWACNKHVHLVKKALLMNRKIYDSIERDALEDAGAEAGQFLDAIGQTDLAMLAAKDYGTFCEVMIDAFGKSLQARLESSDTPF
jgi:hypothetical protein